MTTLERVLVAGLGAGVVGVMTSWLITGVVFHPLQRRTPSTWRPEEGPRQYAAASACTLLAALLLCAAFQLTGGLRALTGAGGIAGGLAFGALCWAALVVPVLGSIATFVNVHRGVVIGLALDWLVVCLLAGGAAGALLPR